ncbi:glycosyltransferase family 4 protein [Roseateles sp. BYS180W]|uniref:Glycosyltransferase family 4 protein n=1 Tax=Roseateles rivi TaxID=3299028 RepID=A0ABW7FW08_9BURK
MKVLISAFACDPSFGSDEEVGWRWGVELSALGHEVTILTRRSHQESIEKYLAKNTLEREVKFCYVDIDWLHRILSKFNRRNHIYYYFWQMAALSAARAVHGAEQFDVVHHVTWVSFRQPSLMWRLGIPFVFGPVAGADCTPAGLKQTLSPLQRLGERVRDVVNQLVRFDPLLRLTFARAESIYVTSPAHLPLVPPAHRSKTKVSLAIGACEARPVAQIPKQRDALFVGRAVGIKGMDLGLQAFALARSRLPDLTLTVVSEGPELQRWKQQAAALGVADAVQWLNWMAREDLDAVYAQHRLLLCPAYRDSGGFVVLEALQCGLPVVCLDLGGPGVIVNDTVGRAVSAEGSVPEVAQRLAQAMGDVLQEVAADEAASRKACTARADYFRWSDLVGRIYADVSALVQRKR